MRLGEARAHKAEAERIGKQASLENDMERRRELRCQVKDEIRKYSKLKDHVAAKAGWERWFEAAKASGIESLVKFAKLKEKRLEGLVVHARYNISTGKLEGFNNRIKVAKRIGYGYRDDDYFFTLTRYMSVPDVRAHSPRKA